jgi:hypothetical protein
MIISVNENLGKDISYLQFDMGSSGVRFPLHRYAQGNPRISPESYNQNQGNSVLNCLNTILIFLTLISGSSLIGKLFYRSSSVEKSVDLYLVRSVLGLGVVSLITFFIGIFTTRIPFLLLFLIFIIIVLIIDFIQKKPAFPFSFKLKFENTFQILLIIGIIVILIEYLILSLTPTMSWDATTHHYLVPKMWIEHGKIIPIPEVVFSEYPSNIELIYMIGMQSAGEIGANAIAFVYGFFLVMAIGVFIYRKGNLTACLIAAFVFISLPLLVETFTGGMIDVGFSLFCFMSFWMFVNYRESNQRKFLYLSAVFAGFAFGSKHLAIEFAVAMILAVVISDLIAKKFSFKKITLDSLTYLGIALLLAAPWYVKSFINTGNPIHPFLPGLFYGWREVKEPISVHAWSHPEYSRGILSLITYPWKITNDFSFLDFWVMAMSPLFLGTIPLWWYYRKRFQQPFFSIAIPFVIIFTLIAYRIAPSSTRYMLPLLCVLSVLTGQSLAFLINNLKSSGRAIVIILLIIPFLVSSLTLAKRVWDVLPNRFEGNISEYREQVFLAKFPDYAAIKWINENLPEVAEILSTDPKGYFFERKFYIGTPGVQSQALPPWSEDDDAKILEGWKKLGITHLLFNLSKNVMKNSYFVYTVTKGIEDRGELRMNSQELAELTKLETEYSYNPAEIDEFGRITQTPFEMVDGKKQYILRKEWWEKTVQPDRTQYMLRHYLALKPYLIKIQQFDDAIIYEINYPKTDLNID